MDVNSKYKYTDDGQLLVRKTVSEPALPGSYPTERKMCFPCSGENPDHHYGIMVLTGWFGYHKFRERCFMQGLFYLLTCGCFGVFYLCDLISMLCGTYCYWETEYLEREGSLERRRKKIYYGPMQHRRRGVFLLLAGVLIVLAAVSFIYQPIGKAFFSWMGTMAAERTAAFGLR